LLVMLEFAFHALYACHAFLARCGFLSLLALLVMPAFICSPCFCLIAILVLDMLGMLVFARHFRVCLSCFVMFVCHACVGSPCLFLLVRLLFAYHALVSLLVMLVPAMLVWLVRLMHSCNALFSRHVCVMAFHACLFLRAMLDFAFHARYASVCLPPMLLFPYHFFLCVLAMLVLPCHAYVFL